MTNIMAEPTLIRDILPEVLHGIQRRYLQNFEPDGKEILQDLRTQIREKGIGRRGKLPCNSEHFCAIPDKRRRLKELKEKGVMAI